MVAVISPTSLSSPRTMSLRENAINMAASPSFRWRAMCLGLLAVTAVTYFTNNTNNNNSNNNNSIGGGNSSSSRKALSSSGSNKNHYNMFRSAGELDNDENQNNQQCRFYLAESAIPQGGLGLYTTVDIARGQDTQPMPDICIYCVDTPAEKTPFDTHSWAKEMFNGKFEGDNPRAACEGFATLVNTMPFEKRTSDIVPMNSKHNAGLIRSQHPGAGAITQYYGVTTRAARNVPAGSEMTITYGDMEQLTSANEKYDPPNRDVNWLYKHGWCVDNIHIDQASDSQMGRGAFARRSLRKGSLVAPAPLQAFEKRSLFAQQQQHAESVFVNYCIQVPNTEILLFPYGPGVNLINHGSSSNQQANVELRWSKSTSSHYSWLDLPLDEFWKMIYPGGLVMEIVALRDIDEGEELFLDYGMEWETAWHDHVQQWIPPSRSEEYVYPTDMDTSTEPFKTLDEQEIDPYPFNLQTVCRTSRSKYDDDEHRYGVAEWKEPRYPWPYKLKYCYILKRNANHELASRTSNGINRSNYTYEVAIEWDNHHEPITSKDTKGGSNNKNRKMTIDVGVPQHAITFVDKPYMSDMNMPEGFRHPIMLPDHLIPETWKKSASSDHHHQSSTTAK